MSNPNPIEIPLSSATYRILSRQLGLTDRAVVQGLKASGLIPEGQSITEDMVKEWRGAGRRREDRGGSGRRPFRYVSTYLIDLMRQVADHEEELVERLDAHHEKTGEPVTIYVPRNDSSVIDAGEAGREWEPYLGVLSIAQALAGRVMIRLVDMGVPCRIDYLDAHLYRQSTGAAEPEFRNDPQIF